jgi:hypothetical protein
MILIFSQVRPPAGGRFRFRSGAGGNSEGEADSGREARKKNLQSVFAAARNRVALTGVGKLRYTSGVEARYPSGKGEVCKTFMRGFDSHPRLHKIASVYAGV